jgi:phosphate-selective porin
MVLLLEILVSPAPATEPSPYPKFIKGEEFFIPDQPLMAYLTVQPRFTAIENDSRNKIDNHFFGWRRLKLRLLGEPLPQLTYCFQGVYKTHNFSPTDNRVTLQEAWMQWKFSPHFKLKVGQTLPPMGFERFTPDEMLLSIERSLPTDNLIPNGKLGDSFARDYGVLAGGFFSRPKIGYDLAIMGGNGANEGHLFRRGSYLLVGRLAWQPYRLPQDHLDLQMGAAMSFRRNHDLDLRQQLPGSGKLGYQHFNGRDYHYNIFLSLDNGPVSFRGEGFWARYHACRPGLPSLNALGFYVQGAYFLHPRLQAVAKFEYFDPNEALHNSQDLRWTTLGLNFYLVGNQLKLQANYIFKNERRKEIHNDTFIVQLDLFLGYPHNPRLEKWKLFSRSRPAKAG